MSKKDYEKAAKMIREYPVVCFPGEKPQRSVLADAFVEFFSNDNPRFDARRFRDACGL